MGVFSARFAGTLCDSLSANASRELLEWLITDAWVSPSSVLAKICMLKKCHNARGKTGKLQVTSRVGIETI